MNVDTYGPADIQQGIKNEITKCCSGEIVGSDPDPYRFGIRRNRITLDWR